MYDTNLGIIGAGNMASAILRGIVGKGPFPKITVSAKTEASLKPWEEKGLNVTTDNTEVMQNSDVIILAVKPQSIEEVMREIGPYTPGKLIVSIVAGVTRRHLRFGLGQEAFLLRAMPNLPLAVGKGATAVTFGYGAPDPLFKTAISVFEACGEVVLVQDKQLDEITAINGSSPAYFFRMIRAMVNWAKQNGIKEEAAKQLAIRSMEGAAAMLLAGDQTVDQLTEKVCSKGGTTLAALSAFDDLKFDELIAEAMTRCSKRSAELSEEFSDTPADLTPDQLRMIDEESRKKPAQSSPLDSLILPGRGL
ncbi:MAG: pyrroline-5-carboxylate reductase [Oscillospiraceae bacterium]|nr:pyrroline-5-carboxylate reductase [Oscillospiraceae bacterium]